MKLLLCVPLATDAMMDVRCAAWCTAMNGHPQVEMRWAQNINCDEGRNALIAAGLADPEVSHFFFLDSDTIPPIDGVQRLMDLNLPVVCGLTPILLHGTSLAWNVRTPDDGGWWPQQRPLPQEPFATRHVGGTTILLQRCVLESIEYPWFNRVSRDPRQNQGTVYQSGDVYFSERINEAGWRIWAHPGVRCSHIKPVDLLSLMMGQIRIERPQADPDVNADEIEREAASEVRVEFPRGNPVLK